MNKKSYILHLDGDSFFVSVELVRLPHLRGKPVVTGGERSIATALSPEAKALGVVRGMPIFQIRERFPQVIALTSNYESYARYSRRMIDVVRRYSDQVEAYSIDECFAQIFVSNDEEAINLAKEIQEVIWRELSITVSVGVANTKVLAKIASKWKKPNGATLISEETRRQFLQATPIGKVWGIGRVSSLEISHLGIKTALDFADKPEWWVKDFLAKPQCEIWNELRGIRVKTLEIDADNSQKSISRTQSFGFSTRDKEFLLSELSRHVEEACEHARSLGVRAAGFTFFLKTKGFRIDSREVKLLIPSAAPSVFLKEIYQRFHKLYDPKELYQTTGVTLWGVMPQVMAQKDLFDMAVAQDKKEEIFSLIDQVHKSVTSRFGGRVISLASSMRSHIRQGKGERSRFEQCFNLPFLGDVY